MDAGLSVKPRNAVKGLQRKPVLKLHNALQLTAPKNNFLYLLLFIFLH